MRPWGLQFSTNTHYSKSFSLLWICCNDKQNIPSWPYPHTSSFTSVPPAPLPSPTDTILLHGCHYQQCVLPSVATLLRWTPMETTALRPFSLEPSTDVGSGKSFFPSHKFTYSCLPRSETTVTALTSQDRCHCWNNGSHSFLWHQDSIDHARCYIVLLLIKWHKLSNMWLLYSFIFMMLSQC